MAEANTDQPVDLSSPEAQALIAQEVAKQVADDTTALVANKDAIIAEKRALEAKYKGIDPVKYAEMMAAADDADDNKLKDAGDYEELYLKRESKLREEYEAKAGDLTRLADEATQKAEATTQALDNRVVGDVIRNAAIKAGVTESGALNNIIRSGLDVFKQENGELVARDSNGDLRKDQSDFVLTPDRYVEGLKLTDAYYFPPSVGAGANGSQQGGGKASLADLASQASARNDMVEFARIRKLMKEG